MTDPATAAARLSQLYFEDFAAGQRYPGQERRLDAAAFRTFAELTGDAHPIHYDAEYARRTRFGAPVAHGLLVAAVGALGATALSPRLEASMVAFLEQGMRFLAPVLEGDTVHTAFEVEGTKPARDGNRGVVRFIVRVNNGAGIPVAEGFHAYLLRCRPQER
ncbi:MAG: MaoC family dehydratase N-terminal domain-containing protein [Burkholderiales bacterium]|nr:MaoC family dehydratase N-terminal domain-containing protein [Burkholderiales bacterium]